MDKFSPYQSQPEGAFLQPAFDVWDEYKKERDTYFKQRGYDDLKASVTWEPETESTGVGSSSYTGGYFRLRRYGVTSVSKADTTIFQELLGYQSGFGVNMRVKQKKFSTNLQRSGSGMQSLQTRSPVSRSQTCITSLWGQ